MKHRMDGCKAIKLTPRDTSTINRIKGCASMMRAFDLVAARHKCSTLEVVQALLKEKGNEVKLLESVVRYIKDPPAYRVFGRPPGLRGS
jgi:hypothetical protein